jgi:hypothetical protein
MSPLHLAEQDSNTFLTDKYDSNCETCAMKLNLTNTVPPRDGKLAAVEGMPIQNAQLNSQLFDPET